MHRRVLHKGQDRHVGIAVVVEDMAEVLLDRLELLIRAAFGNNRLVIDHGLGEPLGGGGFGLVLVIKVAGDRGDRQEQDGNTADNGLMVCHEKGRDPMKGNGYGIGLFQEFLA